MNKISNPLISIITVVYNNVVSIESTILSVINQDYDDFEYILIDGGSTDGTIEVIKFYRDNISHWISEPDKGIYHAMNKGIKAAKGEWCYFLNSGDYFYDTDILSNVSKSLKENFSYSVYIGKVEVFEKNKFKTYYPEFKSDTDKLDGRDLFNSHLCHQAIFVKKSGYLSENGFDLRFKVFSDFNTIFRIIKKEKGFMKSDLVIARYNLDGISADYKNTIPLFLEQELIFKETGAKQNILLFYFNLSRSYLYYLKCSLTNIFK
jgi:glycosyltransferase involved in cell wall biosynthesis